MKRKERECIGGKVYIAHRVSGLGEKSLADKIRLFVVLFLLGLGSYI